MQIKKIPQSCHSGKRWIWLLEALNNTNPSKKLTVPTIYGFTMGHIQLATRLVCMHVSMLRVSYSEVATNLVPPSHLSRRGYVSVLIKVPCCFVLHSIALLDLNLLVMKIWRISKFQQWAERLVLIWFLIIIWFCSF